MSIMKDKESTFQINFNSIFTGIKKELTCSICLSLFTNPVTLSTCHHTFCLKCLKNLTVVVKNSFECPICKKTTHRRSYYCNEKYTRILKLLDILDSFIKTRQFKESKSKKMLTEEKIKKIECYLNDCVSYHMCSEVTTENATVTENKCLRDETKKKKEKLKTKQTKVIQDYKKYLGENIQTKQHNITNIDSNIISDNSSDENEFIADICPTAEKIEIIRKIEDDFLDLIDLEINKDQNPVNLKNTKLILNEIHIDSNINETTDIKNKNCSISEHDRKTGWSRIKDTNLQIRKKGKKYKKLKVTDVKQKKAEKKPILLDNFDEYIENKQIEKKNKLVDNYKNSYIKNVLPDILDEKNNIQNEEDDIFLRSTQKLNLDNSVNNESLGNLTKRKSNDNKEEIKTKRSKIPQKNDSDVIFNKILVDAQVHHELNSEGKSLSHKKLTNQNADLSNKYRIKLCKEQVIVLDSDNDITETDKYVEIKLSKDESSQNLNLHNREKNKETKCHKVTQEHNLDTLRDALNFNLKDICNLKSTMTLQLQQGLKICDNIISNYSNHLNNSESLFSHSNEIQDNHEINKNTAKGNIKINEFYSLPVPDNLSREIIDFYNTAIPNLNNIKEFYRQLEVFSTEISNNSSMLKANQIEINNEDILEKCKNAIIQTDELKCPKCTHTISLENEYLNNSNIERDILNTSNNNLNLQKNVSQKINNDQVNINPDLNTQMNMDERKLIHDTNILNSPAFSTGNIKSPSSESDIILHNNINKIAKRKFNRIITPSSSESEISNSKKAKIENFRSNLLCQYDTEICFDSDSSDNITVHENINQKNESSKESTNEIKQFQNKPSKSQDPTLKYVYSWEKEFKTSNNKNTNNKNADNKVKLLSPNQKYIEFEKETVAYLEQQYKNPIVKQKDFTSNKCDATINSYEIKSLLADIEPSAFDDDMSQITHNCKNNQFSELLFSETDTANTSSKISTTINSNDIIPTSIFTDSEGVVNHNSLNKNNQQSLKILNKLCDENKSDDLEIVEDSLDSIQDIFEDDIVESTPPKNNTLRKSNSENFTIKQNEPKESESKTKKNMIPTKYQSSIINFLNPKKQSTLKDVQNTSIETIHDNHYTTPTSIKSNSVVKQKSHPVICTSRLAVNENSEIMALISKFSVRYSKAFNNSVTHLIVRVDNENRVENQTIKYILAVAHGLWIVSYEWFKDSLACNHLLSEECYEVFDSTGKPGPKMSRLLRNEKPLLRNFMFYLAEPFNAATKLELEDAITNLGGEVKNTTKELVKQPQKYCLILADGSTTNDYSEYQLWRRTLQILVVDVQWLGIVIGQYEVTSFRNFVLCCEDEIEDMGYPPHLIVPMENRELSQTQ